MIYIYISYNLYIQEEVAYELPLLFLSRLKISVNFQLSHCKTIEHGDLLLFGGVDLCFPYAGCNEKKSINVKDTRQSHGVWHNGKCQTIPSDDDRFCIIYTILMAL